MRLLLLGLGLIVLLGSCESTGDTPPSEDGNDLVTVMVDMNASVEDLEALRTLLTHPVVEVAVVALSLADGSNCDEGLAVARTALDEAGESSVPVVCGPSNDGAGDLAGIEDELLDSVDRILVLGPLTNVAALLDRLPQTPILVVAGGTLPDPEAAEQVLEERTITVIPPSISEGSSGETVAAWLVIDETLGSFAVEEMVIEPSGALTTAQGGSTVRVLESVDTARLEALAGEGQPGPSRELGQPRLAWQTDIGLRPKGHHKRPAVVGDLVVVGADDGLVHGISIETGDITWTVDSGFGEGESMATGVASESEVVVLSGGEVADGPAIMFRRLVAIDTRDQSVAWTSEPESLSPEGSVVSSPVISDGVVYAGTAAPADDGLGEIGRVFALDLRTGELLWQSEGFGGPSEPTVEGHDLIVGGFDGTLRVYDRRDGVLRWERQLVSAAFGIASRPLASDGVVYVTGDDGSVHSLDQSSGETLWSVQAGTQNIPASPVLADDRLIVSDFQGGMTWAFDPVTGEEIWSASVGFAVGDPIVVDDTVIVGDFFTGGITGLDVDDGDTVWEFETPDLVDGSPVIAGGLLIFQAGDLFALELPDG